MPSTIAYHDSVNLNAVVDFYNNLTLHIVPGPRSPRYFVPLLILFTTLLFPARTFSFYVQRWVVLPILYAAQLYVWIVDESFDVISMNAMLSAFMLLGYYDVRKDFQKIRWTLPSTGPRRNSLDRYKQRYLESYPNTLHSRTMWVIDLVSSIRLVDWHSPANAINKLPTAPWTGEPHLFYLSNASKGVVMYLSLNLTSGYITHSHSFVKHVRQETHLPWYVESFIFLAHLGAALALYNAFLPLTLSAILARFPGLQTSPGISPLCWPAHFGSPGTIWNTARSKWGLRAFWGVVWHQNMRYITATPGVALAGMVGLRDGSRARYFLILCIAFLLSGIVHMGVIPPRPASSSISCLQLRVRLASFFWVQPVGIAVEVVVLQPLVKRLQQRGLCGSVLLEVMVALWTVAFLALSAWWTVRPVGREMRWLSVHLAPVPPSIE